MRSYEERVNDNLRNAFNITLALKVACALIAGFITPSILFTIGSYKFDTIDVWGIVLPLFVFGVYIAYGYQLVKQTSSRTRLNFADGCYYLGFLFTITTIVLALAEVSHVSSTTGSNDLPLTEIAVRFAGAMISTLIGMGVRLTYVLFERNKSKDQALLEKQHQALSFFERIFPTKPEHLDISINYGDQFTPTNEQDPFEALIRTSCKNMALFNELLGDSLREFENLNDRLKTLNARILADAENTHERLIKESELWMEDGKRQTNELMEELRNGMNKQLEEASKTSIAITEAHAKALEGQVEKAAQLLGENTQSSYKALITANKEAGKALIKANSDASKALIEANAEASKTFTHDATELHQSLQTMTQNMTQGLNSLNDEFKAKSNEILEQHKTLGESLKGSEAVLSHTVNQARARILDVSENMSNLSEKLKDDINMKGIREQIAELEEVTTLLNDSLKGLAQQVEKDGLDHLTKVATKRFWFPFTRGR